MGAFLSAGATLGIASACHRGVIDGCPCNTGENRREDGTTFLHTCNENVDYAIRFVKELYNTEDCDMEVDLVRSHNYRLGYEVSKQLGCSDYVSLWGN